MKTKFSLLIVVIVCTLSPRTSLAAGREQTGKFTISLLGSGGRSLGDFDDVANGILGLGGEIDYSLSSSIKVGVSGIYRWTEITEGYRHLYYLLLGPGHKVEPRIRLYDLMVHLKWLASSSATTRPYLRVELGSLGRNLMVKHTDVLTGAVTTESSTDSALSYGVGGGLEIVTSGRIGAHFEMMFLSANTDAPTKFFELRAAVTLSL